MHIRRTLPIATLLVASTLAACQDQSPLQPTLESSNASATAGPPMGFPVVTVTRDRGNAGNAGPFADNLVDALAKVREGGTVRVQDGTYDVQALLIELAVTIEAANGAAPVLRVPSGTGAAAIVVQQAGEGTVTLRNLVIDMNGAGNYAVRAHDYARVEMDGLELRLGTVSGGLYTAPSGRGGTLRLANSTVSGGVYGVIGNTLDAEFADNRFTGQAILSMQLLGTAQVTGNRFDGCGTAFCIGVYNPGTAVTIAGNHLSDATIAANPYFHNLVEVGWSARATVTDNTFDGCGNGQCMTGFDGGILTATGNRITTYGAHGTRMAIVSNAGTLTIEDNVITGIGATAANDEGAGGYGMHMGAIFVERNGTATVSGNTVTNASTAFFAASGGVITGGSDNVASQVHTAVRAHDGARVTLTRSDFSDYQVGADVSGAGGVSELTCNWWSGGAPPATVGDAALVNYAPWATAPIAGKPGVACG